jgi:NADH:ubiquinone oxidoreductase subunit E
MKEKLYLCMGSACHRMGANEVLPRVEAYLKLHSLTDQVELVGDFCLGPCKDAIVLKFRDQLMLAGDIHNIDQLLDTHLGGQQNPSKGNRHA